MNLFSVSCGVFFWQLFSILFLFIILKFFFFKKAFRILECRKEMIRDYIEKKDEIDKKLESIDKFKNESFERISKEENAKLQEINDLRNKQVTEMYKEVSILREREMESIKAECIAYKKNVEKECEKFILDLAIGVSQKILKRELSEESKQLEFIKSKTTENRESIKI